MGVFECKMCEATSDMSRVIIYPDAVLCEKKACSLRYFREKIKELEERR